MKGHENFGFKGKENVKNEIAFADVAENQIIVVVFFGRGEMKVCHLIDFVPADGFGQISAPNDKKEQNHKDKTDQPQKPVGMKAYFR